MLFTGLLAAAAGWSIPRPQPAGLFRPHAARSRAAVAAAATAFTQALVLNKPPGLVVTHNDELGRATVYDALQAEQPALGRWDAIGRLDLNTSGLLILTNDGWLIRHVTDPTAGGGLAKTYRVLASGILDDTALRHLRGGVDLGAGLGRSRPAEVTVEGHGRTTTTLMLTIREGKNRQVRRMLHAVGSSVLRLSRVGIGSLRLGDLGLAEGEWRELQPWEIEQHLAFQPRALAPPRAASASARASTSKPRPPPATPSSPPPAAPSQRGDSSQGGSRPEAGCAAAADSLDYQLVDSGECERLEWFGGVLIVRSCPSATWRRRLGAASWEEARVRFAVDEGWSGAGLAALEPRDEEGRGGAAAKGGGAAAKSGGPAGAQPWPDAQPQCGPATSWRLRPSGCGFELGLWPGAQGQVGAFPEQHVNWLWLRETCEAAVAAGGGGKGGCGSGSGGGEAEGEAPHRPRVLNLFGYTGGSTLACAAGGAAVTHVDGARASVAQARRNAAASALGDAEVRWLCEDVLTFVRRAVKRGEIYDGVVADPPAFGRGGKKRSEWRIERDLPELLELLPQLLAPSPLLVLLSCHDGRWPATRLAEQLTAAVPQLRRGDADVEVGSMVLRAQDGGNDLPMGCYARCRRDVG